MTPGARGLAAALALAATSASAAGPALVTAPDAPGPDLPSAGRSLIEDLFPDGLPFPFAALLERLRAEAGPENVATALIPLGRSLQRYGATPDYFGSPRVVAAVTGDMAAGPGDARLGDRIFLGYQPAAAVIEAIAYNPAAGRFEFREVVGYGAGSGAILPAERPTCIVCHQGHGPIFPRPLWSESNASPTIAARLGPLGADFHGAPVRQSVDVLEAFDAATDRAARIALANRLWSEGCPDPACRAALLVAAIRVGLGAAAGGPPESAGFTDRAAALWPDGLALVPPDLPNRDPMPMLAEMEAIATLETTGAMDPETPRAPVIAWRAGPDGFTEAAREIAAQFSPGDLAWIDARIARRTARGEARSLPCETRSIDVADGAETRFACASDAGEARGFVTPDGAGRIERLWLGDLPPLGHVPVRAETVEGATRLQASGLAPRLADGRRVAELVLGGGAVALRLTDDLGPLAAGLAARAGDGDPALAAGPFDRRAVLALIGQLTEARDG
jgi:hypothetical protein